MRLVQLAVLLMALGGVTPTLAWDYSESDDTMETWISAWQDDLEGRGLQLALSCSDLFAEESEIQIFTGLTWSDDFAAASPEELRFTIDGEPMSFSARFFESNGEAVLVTNLADDPSVQHFFETIRAAGTGIDLDLGGETYRFGTKGVAEATEQFLNRCGADNVL